MLVQLIHKRSKKTKIIRTDLEGKHAKVLVSQASTDLHPTSIDGQDIYYTKTLCKVGCLSMKQEIWYQNVSMGNVRQLTLNNSQSDQLAIDTQNKLLYFVSLDDRYYHIWQYQRDDAIVKQLTYGEVIDSSPSPYDEGLLFLRYSKGKTKIMKRDKEGKLAVLNTIQHYTKIRNMKVKK